MSCSEPSKSTPLGRVLRVVGAAAALLLLAGCGHDPAPDTAPLGPVGAGVRPGTAPLHDEPTDRPTLDPDSAPVVVTPPPTPSSTSTAPEPVDPPTSSLPAPEPTAPASEDPELITYAGGESVGPLVENQADAKLLTGAPPSFQDFIGRAAEKVVSGADCDGAEVGITVDAVRTDGYAVGAVSECGGYAAMWADVDGTWQEIQGTQDSWDCAILEQYAVPSDLLMGRDTCFDYDGDHREHAYHRA